jgi:hypothetical protein
MLLPDRERTYLDGTEAGRFIAIIIDRRQTAIAKSEALKIRAKEQVRTRSYK